MLASLALNSIVHIAALLTVIAMFFRSPLLLRGFLMASTAMYIAYYFLIPATPLWDAIFWSVVMLAVNAVVVTMIVLDRTQFGMDDEARQLHARLPSLSPGQFRSLMKLATWQKAEAPQVLTREGAPVEQIYFVVDGDIDIAKAGRSFKVEPGFIGEIAFLRRTPASATVTVAGGARYVTWPAKALAALRDNNPALKNALDTLLNADLARKLAAAA